MGRTKSTPSSTGRIKERDSNPTDSDPKYDFQKIQILSSGSGQQWRTQSRWFGLTVALIVAPLAIINLFSVVWFHQAWEKGWYSNPRTMKWYVVGVALLDNGKIIKIFFHLVSIKKISMVHQRFPSLRTTRTKTPTDFSSGVRKLLPLRESCWQSRTSYSSDQR